MNIASATYLIRLKGNKPWKTHCRCGQILNFSNYDIEGGRPAPDCDYWCSDSGNDSTGPHDFGVVIE